MMDGPLLSSSKQSKKKFGRAATPLHWLPKHPVASAVLYLLVGTALVWLLLSSSQNREVALSQHVEPKRGASSAQLTETAANAQSLEPPQTSRATVTPAEALICTDTCYKAKDGICDDGRFVANMTKGLPSTVLCDLGTDCSDCGAWKGVQNSSSWTESVGPVEYLMRQNLTVLTKQSLWDPSFHFAYTDPTQDVDLSRHFHNLGTMEPVMTQIAYHVLHGPCKKQGDGVFVDVGANFGWYSLLAGMLGCRVVAFEPVTVFRAYMEYNIARNKLQDKIELRPTVAVQYPSEAGDKNYTVAAPLRGIWGTASIDGQNINTDVNNTGAIYKYNVSGESLDQVVQTLQLEHVALLKLDVEGYEASVLAGATQLLQKQLIGNILLEYSPHVLERHNVTHLDRAPKMLLSLLAAGYNLGHIARKDFGDRTVKSLSEPLEVLPAITEDNLKFDLFDCMQMTDKGMRWAQEPCKQMVERDLIGDGVPERLHPKSFRSSFEINTNVWASRGQRFVPYLQGPPVGAFPAERKVTDSWFVPEWSDAAMGGRSCKRLQEVAARDNMTAAARAELLIRHRCRCGRTQPCETQEKVADKCAQEGKTPFSDDPDWQPEGR